MRTRARARAERRAAQVIAASLLALAAGVIALSPTQARAQGGEAVEARMHYETCRQHMDADAPCEALTACRAGMALMPTPSLERLTEQATAACHERRPDLTHRCPSGQMVGIGTQGQCCWPGQRWDTTLEACRGEAMYCPVQFVHHDVEGCVPGVCEEGQVRPDDLHCCWPGQRWSRSRKRCIYTPQCPDGFKRDGDGCARLASAPDTDSPDDAASTDAASTTSTDDPPPDDPICPPGHLLEAGRCLADPDLDGVEGIDDLCIVEPEDLDGVEDEDGCPDPDNDNDGVPDLADRCPNEPEDRDGVDDEDGCPDPATPPP